MYALMVSKNYHVTVLDNLSRGSKENISNWLVSPNFKFVLADLLEDADLYHVNKSILQKAVDNSDIIFHLAANPDVVVGADNTRIDFWQNMQATYNLLEAIRKSQLNLQNSNTNKKKAKQLIFASSSTVYGEADKRPTPENYSPLHPISLYGATKLAGEAIISGYCHMFGIQCVVARLANIIGARNTHGVVYDFITKLSSHPDYIDILGNGHQNKSYLYIDDCISALILLSERMEANLENSDSDDQNEKNNDHQNTGSDNKKIHKNKEDSHQKKQPLLEVFNVGSDDTINVLQIAQIVIDNLSLTNDNVKKIFKDNFEGGRGWKGDVPEFWLDCSKLKAAGWRPKYGNSRDAVIQTCIEYLNTNRVRVRRNPP